jgi:hypothetical protein
MKNLLFTGGKIEAPESHLYKEEGTVNSVLYA